MLCVLHTSIALHVVLRILLIGALLLCHHMTHTLQVIPLEAGPLSERASTSAHAHVLRAPNLAITEDWVVEIVKA